MVLYTLLNLASKRHIRKRACLDKRVYTDEEQAKAHAEHLRSRGEGANVRHYKCKWADHWHVGHAPLSSSEYAVFGKDRHRG